MQQLNKTNFLISLLLIFGGIGSILFGNFPIFSSILIFLGVCGSIISIISSESRNNEFENIIEAQAILSLRHGIGNVYMQAFNDEMHRGISFKGGLRLLKKAIDLDPNDIDALSFLSSFIALQLSMKKWLPAGYNSYLFIKELSYARKLAEHGRTLSKKNHILLDTLGILSDLEGNHTEARKYFKESSMLRADPYWRLLMATSWHMSGEHHNAVNELNNAKKEGAKGWLFNFYFGRSLNSIGKCSEALKYLQLSYQERGFHPELVYEIAQSYYLRGYLFKAAKNIYYLFLKLIFFHIISGLKFFLQATAYIAIGLTCSVSKFFWKHTRHIPFLQNIHLKLFPPDEPEFTLGNILLEKGNVKEAEKNFRLCCEIIPEKAESYANLAICMALQGAKEKALAECDKSIELAPNNDLFKHTRQQIQTGYLKRIVNQQGHVVIGL